jgi:3-oxoacyl-[acyl-carrier protein] reductase
MKAKEIALEGKTALVTGGSRGIGKAIVELLLDQGMYVWATSRNWRSHDRSTYDKPAGRSPDFSERFYPEDCDNGNPDQIEDLFKKMRRESTRLDLLVNNAGIGHFGPCEQVSLSGWEKVMNVNARGVFIFSRNAFSWMKDTGGGRIINISSVVGIKGYTDQVIYTASKHAIMGITKVMAKEGQPWNIRVSVICPGGVDTDLIKEARPDLDRTVLIQPADVARAVLYLATEPESCSTDILQLRRAGSAPFT